MFSTENTTTFERRTDRNKKNTMTLNSKNFIRRTIAQGIEGEQGPQGEQGPPGAQGPQGNRGGDGADGASILWRGPWVSPGESDYLVNHAVSHNGSSYICILDHLNAASLEPGVAVGWEAQWDLMAAAGV